MSWETDNPVTVVDEESNPPRVVARYPKVELAEWHIANLAEHGGAEERDKVERGGYGIDAPEVAK